MNVFGQMMSSLVMCSAGECMPVITSPPRLVTTKLCSSVAGYAGGSCAPSVQDIARPPESKRHSVYLVKSDFMPIVKLGRWSGTLGALQSRYHTVYTKSISLYTFSVQDGKAGEKLLKRQFERSKICGELYSVDEDTPLSFYVQTAADLLI